MTIFFLYFISRLVPQYVLKLHFCYMTALPYFFWFYNRFSFDKLIFSPICVRGLYFWSIVCHLFYFVMILYFCFSWMFYWYGYLLSIVRTKCFQGNVVCHINTLHTLNPFVANIPILYPLNIEVLVKNVCLLKVKQWRPWNNVLMSLWWTLNRHLSIG